MESYAAILDKNYIVEKSKPLIWSKFSEYSLGQMRLLDTYLSKINARDENTSEVVFPVNEYLTLLGYRYPNKVTSKEVDASLDKFLEAKIHIDLDNNGSYKKVNLFSDATVIKDAQRQNRAILIDCNPKLKKAFFDLAERGYIEYKLEYSLRLRSKYSIKLYSLLKDNLFRKEWKVDVNELKELIGATNKNNENFREFNKILVKCQNEINEITDISYSYEKVARGRLIKAIIFRIKKKFNKKTKEPKSNTKTDFENQEEMQEEKPMWQCELDDFKFSKEEIKSLGEILKIIPKSKLPTSASCYNSIDIQWLHYIKQKVAEFQVEKSKQKINNNYKYFYAMLKNDSADE